MLSYDEVMSFSEDAEIGFVQLDDAARKRMYENSGDPYGWGPARTYITFIFAYIDENNINIDINRNVPIGGDGFSDYFDEFINTIDYFKSRLIFRQKNNTKNGITTSLYLNDGYKEEINGLLNKIKSITYNTKLPDKKKDAIFNKINALSSEVDRVLTRTDALLSLYLDVTNAIGEGVENLEPLFSGTAHETFWSSQS